MFGADRQQLRQTYALAWEKFQQQQVLTPLESQIVDVIKLHPEYHKNLGQLDKDFLADTGESNPFLHMGLHLGLREQLATNRPPGILSVYQQLCKQLDPHEVEHRMMDCLAHTLYMAQSQQQMPDEQAYLRCLNCIAHT